MQDRVPFVSVTKIVEHVLCIEQKNSVVSHSRARTYRTGSTPMAMADPLVKATLSPPLRASKYFWVVTACSLSDGGEVLEEK